jgi:glycosyltransferase involved in cell wall biosynthesis
VARFTVLLPVHRPPATLPYAIETVLAQSHADLELLVICDGAPDATVACARDYAARDPRTTVLAFPKGERHGEAYRHLALERATGEYVAHISDDDLWLPDHLASLEKLLAGVDFGHVIHVMIHPDGRVEALAADLADPALRQRLLDEPFNRFGLSFGAYRLDAYRRLPEGWAPAPLSVPTDHHMWRKFLRHPGLRFGTHLGVTAVQFAAPVRSHMSLKDRARENRQWRARLLDPREREVLEEAAWRSIVAQAVRSDREHAALALIHARVAADHRQLEATLARVLQSRSWRWTGPLRSCLATVRRLGPARRQPDRPGS